MGDSVVTCNQLYYEGYKYTFRPKCEVGDSGSVVVTGNSERNFRYEVFELHYISFNIENFYIDNLRTVAEKFLRNFLFPNNSRECSCPNSTGGGGINEHIIPVLIPWSGSDNKSIDNG